MKQFEDRVAYQGSAQSQGFSPVQAPDVTPLLRENMQTQQRSMDNVRQARLQEMDLNRLTGLAAFSETISNSLIEQAKQKAERDQEEGLQLAYVDGLPKPVTEAYDKGIQQLEQAHEGVQQVADKAQQAGEPFEAVQQIRNLSGWKKYGYAMGMAKMAGEEYGPWLADQLKSNSTSQIQVGDRVFVPTEAKTPAEKAAATAVLRTEYMRSKGLVGLNPALLNKHAFPQFRDYEQRLLDAERKQYIKEQQEIAQEEAISRFTSSGDKGQLFATTIQDLERSGLSRGDARQRVIDNIESVEDLNAIGRTTSWDGKLTWEEKYKIQFRDARSKLMQRLKSDEDLKDGLRDQEQENWTDEVIASFGTNPVSEDVVDKFIEASRSNFNGKVDQRLLQYKENLTLEARGKKEQEDYLWQLYNRDELTVEELRSGKYNPQVRDAFMAKAQQQDKMREPEVKEARKPAENAVANELKRRAGLLQAGATPHWSFELAKAHASRQLAAKARVYMQSGASADEAFSRAAQDVIADIAKDNPDGKQGFGTYSVGKDGQGDFLRWSRFGSGGKGGLAAAQTDVSAIRSQVRNGGTAVITGRKLIDKATAESMVNPDSPIAPIISIIQNALPAGKEMSEFDIIDAQLSLHGLPPRQRPYVQQVVQSALTPRQQALLNRTPDSFRTRRALTEGNVVGPGQERQAIQYIANQLGVDPIDVATFINYETDGSLVSGKYRRGLDTWGGSGGKYFGWIQFSPDNQQKYGVRPGMSPMEMADAVVKYMKNAGVKRGDSLDMLYQAVQAPAYIRQARARGRNIGADSNGSISDHVARMRREHQSVAGDWLTQGSTATMTSVYRDPRLLSAPARKLLSQWTKTSGFGSQESFRSKPHEGNDYATPVGTKLSFKQSGVVIDAKPGSNDRSSNGGYGGYIDVRLADGNVVRIGHLSDVFVRKGQRLRPKQIAALTGSTGRSTGPHAHIEHLSGPTGLEETMKGKRNPSWIASQVYADI